MTTFSPGLENVIAAETALSDVDGARGRLVIAGDDVETLAARGGFEEVAAALWNAAGLSSMSGDAVRAALGQARAAAFARLSGLGDAFEANDGMEALRAAVAHLTSSGQLADDAMAVTGAVGVFAAAWARRRAGLGAVEPDPAAPHAADVLRMVTGELPSPARVRGLDRYLTTVSDHGMNASTFVARIVASTGSDVVSAVTAAI